MKDEKNNIPAEQVYGMFEEIKEMIEKRPAPETSGGTTENSDTVIWKLEENKTAIDRSAEQIAGLTNRIGQIDFQPVIKVQPPDFSGLKEVFQYIDSRQEQLNNRQQRIEEKIEFEFRKMYIGAY